jgi:beta-glucosidase/6-phospho-beta-glucosidase/beta-galactosidase
MQGIKPLVTLYHLDMPLALSNKGGWMNREGVKLIAPHQRMGISLFKLSERFGIIYSWIRFSKDIMYGACLIIWSG